MALFSLLVSLALLVMVGVIASRSSGDTEEDYWVGGRSFGRYFIGLSAGASSASSFVMIGAVGVGFWMGLSALLLPLSALLGDLIFWSIFPKKVNQFARVQGVNTVPEMLSLTSTDDNKIRVRKIAAVITFPMIGLYAAAQMVAAGKTMNVIIDTDLTWGIVLSAVVVIAYCAKGGLKASIVTQFVQALVMLFTCVGALVIATVVAGGPGEIMQAVLAIDPILLSLQGNFSFGQIILNVIGFAVATLCLGLALPYLLVRMMATSSPQEARQAGWVYIVFVQTNWIAMTLFGIILRVLIPDIQDAEQGLPIFALNYLPPIVVGLVAGGIFATIASTIDAQLLVLSSSLTVDLFPKLHEKLLSKYGAIYRVSVMVLIAAFVVILALNVSSTVFSLILSTVTVLGASLGLGMFIVLLEWRTHSTAMIAAIVSGFIAATAWQLLGFSEIILETLPGFLFGLMVHMLVMKFVVSKQTGKP